MKNGISKDSMKTKLNLKRFYGKLRDLVEKQLFEVLQSKSEKHFYSGGRCTFNYLRDFIEPIPFYFLIFLPVSKNV